MNWEESTSNKMKKGQILLELLIAIGIFIISVSSLIFFVLDGYISGRLAREMTIANFLAEEGIEAARSIRDNNWDDLVAGNHGLAILNGNWVFQGAEEDVSDQLRGGIRQIQIEDIDSSRKKIISLVSWQFGEGIPQEISLVTYLTKWKAVKKLVAAMKTEVDGYFYIPIIEPEIIKVVFLSDNSKLEGDQTGGKNEYDHVPDGRVDIRDSTLLNAKYGLEEGDPGWEYMADIYADRKIDIYDVVKVSNNYGNRGDYITDLTGVTILFDTGEEISLNQNNEVIIPPGAKEFWVKKEGSPIGAYVLFYAFE